MKNQLEHQHALLTACTQKKNTIFCTYLYDYYVGNFRQNNNYAEDGIDETSGGLCRRNSVERNSELFSLTRNGSEWMLSKTIFFFAEFRRSVFGFGIDSSVELGMPWNEHGLPLNNCNRSESIPRNFFGTKFRSQP